MGNIREGPAEAARACSRRCCLTCSWGASENTTYLCISAADHPKQNLSQFFSEDICFIPEARRGREGCQRSGRIMTVSGRGRVESLAAVRAARPCAGPNLGFLRQLEEFQHSDLQEYRTWWRDRYGRDSDSDDVEVGALLDHRSGVSSFPPRLTHVLPTPDTRGSSELRLQEKTLSSVSAPVS